MGVPTVYSLVSALAKSFDTEGRWTAVDIGDVTFSDLYSLYTRVIATLTNPFLEAPVALELADIREQIGSPSLTFSQFLTANGNTVLPTSDMLPVLTEQTARYMDAFKAGYSVQPIAPNAALDAQLPAADKTWLYLTKAGVDFNLFQKYCLVSVNGFLHQIDCDSTSALVMEGNRSAQLSNEATIGIINFQKVSSLTYLPITSEMIYKQTDDQTYRNHMYVDLGQDVSGKGLALVLGGYLHFLDTKTFFRISASAVCIDFNNLPLFERFNESFPYIDYSSLPYQRTKRNVTQFAVDDFLSDENLVAYATLSQSFFVLFDNPELYKDSTYVPASQVVGKLISYSEPTAPLMNGIGKLADYWSVEEDGQWALSVVDNYWWRRVYNTAPLLSQQGISDMRVPTDPVRHSRASFLLIGTDLQQSST